MYLFIDVDVCVVWCGCWGAKRKRLRYAEGIIFFATFCTWYTNKYKQIQNVVIFLMGTDKFFDDIFFFIIYIFLHNMFSKHRIKSIYTTVMYTYIQAYLYISIYIYLLFIVSFAIVAFNFFNFY